MNARADASPVPSGKAFLVLVLIVDLLLIGVSAWSPLLLALSLGGLVTAVLWSRPHWALAFAVAGLPLLDPIFVRAGRSPSDYPLGLALLAVPVAWILWSEPWSERPGVRRQDWIGAALRDPVVVLTLALALLLQCGTLWTRAPLYGGSKALLFALQNVVIIVAARMLLDRGRGAGAHLDLGLRFLQCLVIFEVGVALLSVWNYFAHFYEYDRRLRALGLNTIWLARHMGMGVLALWALWSARRISRGWAIAIAGLFFLIFYLAGSRGPLVAFVPALALWWIMDPARRGRARLAFTVGLALVGIVGALVLIETGAILGNTPFAGHDVSNIARLLMLRTAQENLGDIGFLGFGTGSFGPLMNLGDIRAYPHNIFLEIGLENGLLGLLLFGAFLAVVVRRWQRAAGTGAHLRENDGRRAELLVRTAGVQGFFALACAQFSGDLPNNPWIWLWAGALAAWAR